MHSRPTNPLAIGLTLFIGCGPAAWHLPALAQSVSPGCRVAGESITCTADDAPAILSSETGAAGVDGADDPVGALFLSISVGGDGTAGSDGAAAQIGPADTAIVRGGGISTSGERSSGLQAQSTGGDGGNGGAAAALSIGLGVSISIAVGGEGGEAGDGGDARITGGARISTTGEESFGVVVRSQGGQGSDGGAAASLAISTGAALSASAAGGGGAARNGGAGGSAAVASDFEVVTSGVQAHGVLAESLGGAGGNGGGSLSIAGAPILPIAASSSGRGGDGGRGGVVSVNTTGTIRVEGDQAQGIQARSVGGEGGDGGASIALPVLGSIVVGGDGGTGGQGNRTSVRHEGRIDTAGSGGHGILAESLAGNGGAGGTVLVGVGGQAGAAGNAGAVDATISGEGIRTTGAAAHGIVARSVGGQGSGAAVDIAVTADIDASGDDSHGILATSTGLGGAGNITIRVDSGTVLGGNVTGAGVRMENGADNTLTNRGTVAARTMGDAFAVVGTTGDETVRNFGIVAGSVDLGGGVNRFENETGGIFETGTVVNLGGPARALRNAGTLSPGGTRSVLTTRLVGQLTQTGTGRFLTDLDFASGRADRIQISAGADLDGAITVQPLNSGASRPGVRENLILTAGAGVTDSGVSMDAPTSAVASYELLFPNTTDVVLRSSVNYSPEGDLNPNQRRIADHVNAIQLAGGSAQFAPVAGGLFAQPDLDSLKAAYDRLSPEPFIANRDATLFASLQLKDALMSCRTRGAGRFLREGQCSWMRFAGGELNQDDTRKTMGFEERAFEIAAGMQKIVAQDWRVGVAAAYRQTRIDVEDLSRSDGDLLHAGATLKRSFGATSIAASASAGRVWYDTDRIVNVAADGGQARGDSQVSYVAAYFRVAHTFEHADTYVRPMLDAGVTQIHRRGFTEKGAAGANLVVDDDDDTIVSVRPAVEIGTEYEAADGALVRPFLKLGVTQFLSGTRPEVTAAFLGTPAGVPTFNVAGELDRTHGDLSAGLDVLGPGGLDVRFEMAGRFSQRAHQVGGGLKLSLPF